MGSCSFQKTVEKWGLFEVRMRGKADGNPFADYEIRADFSGNGEKKTVSGFYDGNGEYARPVQSGLGGSSQRTGGLPRTARTLS